MLNLRDNAVDSKYITANCVVFTYYSGDITSIIDEHFSKSLSQSNNPSPSTSYSDSPSKSNKDGGPPMSHRSFPPSFWDINHQALHHSHHHHPHHASNHASSSGLCIPPPPPGSSSTTAAQVHELYAASAAAASTDPYHHHAGALHHPAATIHHQNDPWHYTLSASAASNPYTSHHLHHHHHRAASAAASAIHDLGYSSASNRFNAQYGSLLLPPSSMRSTRLTPVSGTYSGFDKTGAPDMSWTNPSRYHDTMNFGSHHGVGMDMPANYTASAYGAAMSAAMSGLENQVQDSSKDLYWF